MEITQTRLLSPEPDFLQFLTKQEADEIHEQFQSLPFLPGNQVMWTGVPQTLVQRWSDENGMKTLTTSMGPLMDKKHPSCPRLSKNKRQWRRYIKGASGIYAYHVPKGNVITVLSRPPPQRLNPLGCSTYQTIEEPVLKGAHGGTPVSRIYMVHITVVGAENDRYQVWPNDETHKWIEKHGWSLMEKQYMRDNKSAEVSSSNEKSACNMGHTEAPHSFPDATISSTNTFVSNSNQKKEKKKKKKTEDVKKDARKIKEARKMTPARKKKDARRIEEAQKVAAAREEKEARKIDEAQKMAAAREKNKAKKNKAKMIEKAQKVAAASRNKLKQVPSR